MKNVLLATLALLFIAYQSFQYVYSSNSSAANAQQHSADLKIAAIVTERHTEYPTYYAHVNGIRIAYQDFGDTDDQAILLVMGLGGQLIHWEDSLVFSLVDHGYRVIRFDNRDSGWSSKLHTQGAPDALTLMKYKLGISLGAPYKLNDMANDAIGLLDHLKIKQSHVAGISMGGMIAQIMAAQYPERVTTLTSIMSTSGDSELPSGELQPSLENLDGYTRSQIIHSRAQFAQQIDGNIAELSAAAWIQRMARGYDRAYYPNGTARQLWAIADSGDRVELLKRIKQPTLVIHGSADNLIPSKAGEHTAKMVAHSRFVLLNGMGHFIDPHNEPLLVAQMLALYADKSVPSGPTNSSVAGR